MRNGTAASDLSVAIRDDCRQEPVRVQTLLAYLDLTCAPLMDLLILQAPGVGTLPFRAPSWSANVLTPEHLHGVQDGTRR